MPFNDGTLLHMCMYPNTASPTNSKVKNMDKRSFANQLVNAFGTLLTIDGLQLGDHDNSCVLLFDNNLELSIEYDDPAERLVFSIAVDTLRNEESATVLRQLLAGNYYWMGASGATICLDGTSGDILLIYGNPLMALDDRRFERIVENLLDAAEQWRTRIAEIRASAPAASEGVAHQIMGPGATLPIYG